MPLVAGMSEVIICTPFMYTVRPLKTCTGKASPESTWTTLTVFKWAVVKMLPASEIEMQLCIAVCGMSFQKQLTKRTIMILIRKYVIHLPRWRFRSVVFNLEGAAPEGSWTIFGRAVSRYRPILCAQLYYICFIRVLARGHCVTVMGRSTKRLQTTGLDHEHNWDWLPNFRKSQMFVGQNERISENL